MIAVSGQLAVPFLDPLQHQVEIVDQRADFIVRRLGDPNIVVLGRRDLLGGLRQLRDRCGDHTLQPARQRKDDDRQRHDGDHQQGDEARQLVPQSAMIGTLDGDGQNLGIGSVRDGGKDVQLSAPPEGHDPLRILAQLPDAGSHRFECAWQDLRHRGAGPIREGEYLAGARRSQDIALDVEQPRCDHARPEALVLQKALHIAEIVALHGQRRCIGEAGDVPRRRGFDTGLEIEVLPDGEQHDDQRDDQAIAQQDRELGLGLDRKIGDTTHHHKDRLSITDRQTRRRGKFRCMIIRVPASCRAVDRTIRPNRRRKPSTAASGESLPTLSVTVSGWRHRIRRVLRSARYTSTSMTTEAPPAPAFCCSKCRIVPPRI